MVKVIYTIDVEGHDGINPFQTLVWGNHEKIVNQGIDKIMDLADKYEVKGLFFVDFAAAWEYGEGTVAEVVHHIINRGHDVGVHIHPEHMADKERKFLSDYSYEEQFSIINDCTNLYIKLTNKIPKSFRAGRYSANNDTLDILSKIGYKYDFSEFYGQKWCKISPPVTSIVPVKYKEIVEIPVTSFQSIQCGNYRRIDRLDGATDTLFFKRVINNVATVDNTIVTMFSHSFSFIDWRGHPESPKEDKVAYQKTDNNFRYLKKQKDIIFIAEADLKKYNYPRHSEFPLISLSNNPLISAFFILRTAYLIRRANRKARILITFLELTSIIILFIIINCLWSIL